MDLPVAVAMSGVVKRFGSLRALDGVDLAVRPGEVHALLGENGAGKTTLMRILAGLERPDAGTVEVLGEPVERFDPGALRRRGVALVQQHFTLVPTFTAGENLALSRPSGWRRPGSAALRARIEALAGRYDLPVRADVPVGELSVGEQQRLELLRALDADAAVLVLDEPTAVLTDAEADRLLAVCRGLADGGRSVVVITHRLREVLAGCDRVTVLRGGRVVVAGEPTSGHTASTLAQAMVGDAGSGSVYGISRCGEISRTQNGEEARLVLRGVRCGVLDGVDLDVAAGEVLGVAGVDGNGQADLEALLSCRTTAAEGTVRLDGGPWPATPRARVAARVGYIPSDRYRYGLARSLDLADNLGLGRTPGWRPRRRQRRRAASGPLGLWGVRSAGAQALAATLSGGNAQKVVLARELPLERSVVLACYATRGLDPQAARLVVDRVLDQAARGAAVLWIGAELDELLAVADRLVVLTGGRVAGRFDPPYDREALGLAMSGAGVVEVGA